MQINIGDIIITDTNVIGVITAIEINYKRIFIYWNDGIHGAISRDTLEIFIAQKKWQYYAN